MLSPDWVHRLIRLSPERDDALENWDENPNIAIRKAVDSIMQSYGPKDYREAMEAIWYDFYGHNTKKYVEIMGRNFDGFILQRTGCQHFICFRPSILHVVGVEEK